MNTTTTPPDAQPQNATEQPTQSPSVATPSPAQETITIPKQEYDRLRGTLGDLMEKQRRRDEEEKQRLQQEQIARGEHEKVISTLRQENETLKQMRERYEAELAAQWQELSETVKDDRFNDVFRKPQDGKTLSCEDLLYNIAEYRKFKKLGVIGGNDNKKAEPSPRVTVPPPKPQAEKPLDQMTDAEFMAYRRKLGVA